MNNQQALRSGRRCRPRPWRRCRPRRYRHSCCSGGGSSCCGSCGCGGRCCRCRRWRMRSCCRRSRSRCRCGRVRSCCRRSRCRCRRVRSCCCRCRRWALRRPSRSRTRAASTGDVDLHRRYRVRAVVSPYAYCCITHMCPIRERTLQIQRRPVAPAVANRIIHLQGVCRIGSEQPLQPCSQSLLRGHRRCRRTVSKGIATAEDPQIATNHRRTRHVDPTGQIRPLRPRVGRNVVVIQRVQVRVIDVAATSHIHVPVDNPKARASQCSRHARPRCIEGVGHRIILPYLAKGRIDISCVISTDQVDLAVEIARSHEGAHIRHRCPSAPRVCGNVIDARGIHHRSQGELFTAEDEELVHIRRIHPGSLAVIQIGHRRKRRPRVGRLGRTCRTH